MSNIKTFFLLINLLLISQDAFAFKLTPELCREYGLGKNWYCGQSEEDIEEPSANEILNLPLAPEEKAAALNELWDLQRKRAVITEDKSEISRFLETHNLIAAKGVNFARNVSKVIDTSPKYANSESYYKNVAESKLKEEEAQEILKYASKRYSLVFVYSSSCSFCAKQYPIIYQFKQQHKFTVLGVSVDGGRAEGLDEIVVDPEITNDPLVQAFPTLLLLDREQPAKIFLARGITTLDEIERLVVERVKEREMGE